MRGIYVPISDEPTRRALVEYAEREWRDPRDQAALLIVEGLRRAGALSPEQETTAHRSSEAPASVGAET